MCRFSNVSGTNFVPIFTVCCAYLRSARYTWNVILLINGMSQKVIALGLDCLLLVVESVLETDYQLPCMT